MVRLEGEGTYEQRYAAGFKKVIEGIGEIRTPPGPRWGPRRSPRPTA